MSLEGLWDLEVGSGLMPGMPTFGGADFAADWTKLEEQTRAGAVFGGGYDEPCHRLVQHCRGTALARFHPFTSMNRLCFAESRFPFEGIQPGFIEFYPDGRYVVFAGPPYPGDAARPSIDTRDASAAVAAALELLAGGGT